MAIYDHPRLLPAGDRALTIELADEISPEVNTTIRALGMALGSLRLPGLVEIVPTYRSLLVYYDPLTLPTADLEARVLGLAGAKPSSLPPPRLLQIPTHYGGEHGPDMDFVARHTGLSPEEVAAVHSGTDYLVYMMGFNTGFPYLGGMSARLAVPRLDTPRTIVPAGSVAIAQQQTGIYPVESPGGWRIIGRSPVRLFNADREPPVAVEAGDYLRFVPIDERRYREIESDVQANAYQFVVTEKV